MDRFIAMIILLGCLVMTLLLFLAFFAFSPVLCSCVISLLYSLYLFFAYEQSGVHHAQEFENRFWTLFGVLSSTALFFANDSPFAFGRHWNPTLGLFCVALAGYGMHVWDRHHHRTSISQQTSLRRGSVGSASLRTLTHLGLDVEEQLATINACLLEIDQLLIPSTINNFINQQFVLQRERKIISIFEECDARALNYLVSNVKLALLFYKIKDHRTFHGQNRTRLIQLLAFDRLPILTVMSRVIVLHSLQLLKIKANPSAELWVRNIFLNTRGEDLSHLKTLMDGKGDYFCMTKLIYDDLRNETSRQEILSHIEYQGVIQNAQTREGSRRTSKNSEWGWRKILSDVDDTLLCSGGSYPAGIDKRYGKKVVYPGVLAFYRELDLGLDGPDEWPENRVGNLVFLSARPHVYKDVSEKHNFAKFEKLRASGEDGRKGMHTMPSLLAGDISSGTKYMVTNSFEHLALKKFENFERYRSIFPEYKHCFIADNGQGDVRAAFLMHQQFPYDLEACYIHVVQDRMKTHGYDLQEFHKEGFAPCFFTTYPEAAIHAAAIADPPLISMKGLQRVCLDATKDFKALDKKAKWATARTKAERRMELNQAIWKANFILNENSIEEVPLIEAEQLWAVGQKVRTPYGIGSIRSFDAVNNLYEVSLDWRPLNVQLAEHLSNERKEAIVPRISKQTNANTDTGSKMVLETVVEIEEIDDDAYLLKQQQANASANNQVGIDAGDDGIISGKGIDQVLASLPDESQTDRNHNMAKTSTSDEGTHNTESATGESHSRVIATNVKADESSDICYAVAFVAGHLVTKYTPPVLPKLDKTKGSIFTFWSPSASKDISKYKAGEHCATPFGNGKIEEHRPKEKVVVVKMVGWNARAYLREEDVKVTTTGLFRSLFRKMSNSEIDIKPKEFPYISGTIIDTPYGRGEVSIPLPFPTSKDGLDSVSTHTRLKRSSAMIASKPDAIADLRRTRTLPASVGKVNVEVDSSLPTSISAAPPCKPAQTIGISLTSWTLANGTHPTLYTPLQTAEDWKQMTGKDDGKGIISATVGIVSRTLLGPFMTHRSERQEKDGHISERKEKQYYADSAMVTTQYGNGVVSGFRSDDGFYSILLKGWTLSDGSHPVAYLRKDKIRTRKARGCQEGYPVYIKLGVTGILASVQPETGVHIITVPSAGMVCYLQPDDVLGPVKAAVGEDVLTPYGEGVVEHYRREDDMYRIFLKEWPKATLYAKADSFDRVNDRTKDNGSYGMKWLFDMFFASGESKSGPGTRSRSNSVTSGKV